MCFSRSCVCADFVCVRLSSLRDTLPAYWLDTAKKHQKIQTISYHKLHLLTVIPSLNSCLKLSTGLKCLLYSLSEHCSFICFYGYHEQKTVLKGYGRIYVCFGKCVFFLSRIRSNLILTLLFFQTIPPFHLRTTCSCQILAT